MTQMMAKILKRFGIIVGVLAGIYFICLIASSIALYFAQQELIKAGRPMEINEIAPMRIGRDEENAVEFYKTAILCIAKQPGMKSVGEGDENPNLLESISELMGKKGGTYPKQPFTDKDEADLNRLLLDASIQEALKWVEDGNKRSKSSLNIDYTKGIEGILPNLSSWRSLSRVIGAYAQNQAEEGNVTNAWRVALAGLKSADAFRNEPMLIAQLVRLARICIAMESIRDICALAPPPDNDYKTAQELLKSFDDIKPLFLAFDGERIVFGHYEFEKLMLPLTERNMRCNYLLEVILRPWLQANHADYLKNMAEMTMLETMPDSLSKVEKYAHEIEKHSILFSLSRLVTLNLYGIGVRFYNFIAFTRVTGTGLAVLRYKQTYRKYPQNLSEIEVWNKTDPYSGKELIYRAEGDGFILYSIGPDCKDDGGSSEKDADGMWKDLVWKFSPKAGK
jgi:hypothetical protein